MSDRILTTVSVQNLTSETLFENFESLTLIDAGHTDGFQIAGTDGVFGSIPTGISINFAGQPGKLCEKITVKATAGKPLNVTAIIFQ